MSEQQIPSRLVFRVPQVSILAALLVAICATPMAAALPVLSVVYVLPLAAIVWIVRVRTVADASGLTVRKVVGSRSLAWDDLKGLLLIPKGTVTAVTSEDTRIPLPSVRTRHLPALALISGGRITDPTADASTPADAPSPADATPAVATSPAEATPAVATSPAVATPAAAPTPAVATTPSDAPSSAIAPTPAAASTPADTQDDGAQPPTN